MDIDFYDNTNFSISFNPLRMVGYKHKIDFLVEMVSNSLLIHKFLMLEAHVSYFLHPNC